MDLYLPEGISIEKDSWRVTERCDGHTVYSEDDGSGHVRVVCLSMSNKPFYGNNGAIVTFKVRGALDLPESGVIELKNQLYSTVSAKEYSLPDSSTTVTKDDSYSGITCPEGAESVTEKARYDVNGRLVGKDYRGIIIIEYTDGRHVKRIV